MCFGSNCDKMFSGCEKVEWKVLMKEYCKSKYFYCMRDWSGDVCVWWVLDEYKRCLKKIL